MGEEGRHFLHNVGKMYKLFIFHMQAEECDGCFGIKKIGSINAEHFFNNRRHIYISCLLKLLTNF